MRETQVDKRETQLDFVRKKCTYNVNLLVYEPQIHVQEDV